MRLICPNCNAQYVVDDSVIPDSGRDVQCSNCGHAWFQLPEGAAPPEAPDMPEAPEVEPGAPEVEAPEAEAPEPEAPEPAPDADTEAVAPSEEAPPAPRRSLDPSLMAVLREEAEREARARRREAGLPEDAPEAEAAADPDAEIAAMMAGSGAYAAEATAPATPVADFPAPDPDPEPDPPPRRDRLPDIEEINSTLRATSERAGDPVAADAPETVARNRSGFRLGFGLALAVAAAGLGVYASAPQIAARVPALAPALGTFVETIDRGRVWLDAELRALTDRLDDSQEN
ncbi:zinc-ribbon domain-containing protein [Phaeovulum vinaykumarii]|uniref:MJ0042 family finger-like domain-containing protein n=1 Tax=Phaeovulum vinaykumarii TaxID=407234 RepID=A0A1N7KS39_9RHOB|nr:zinc-ribbon domain-containing protein [Phaeovulum vinaykumarii]SIS64423.1 MJ0042 family finger-like domain-containing protein [Phaeovulum vinaykumarii]SOC01588.1 predicted Zn finger-like uncharacterized protein [Phaeovulum vinaykumarii]